MRRVTQQLYGEFYPEAANWTEAHVFARPVPADGEDEDNDESEEMSLRKAKLMAREFVEARYKDKQG